MATLNDDNRSKSLRVGRNRWTRVREAYQSGELDRQNIIFQPEQKRQRRNALADISTVSTNADASSQKHQFHQLVERVRELQKEIVPDLLLYQMPQTYSPFSPVTPSSNPSRDSISLYPHRQSLSISSGSSNSSVPNPRFNLSSRILERAHQIPERFWIDWQQKQMQDQIEELEYIKNNIGCSSTSSLLSNETDENGIDLSAVNRRTNYDEIRRESLLFLHEAQRLANERRASLAQTTTVDTSIPKDNEKLSDLSENEDHNAFNFDQRSEETADADVANLNDLTEASPKATTPILSVQQSPSTLDRSRLTISLPFTYTNTREQTRFSNNYRQICTESMLEKVIEVNDDAIQITSPTNSIEDVAHIDTELNLTLIKQEHPKQINSLLYSKATINRSIEFRKFRPILSRNTTISSKKDIPIHISVFKRKEIDDSRSSSPTLSFKSTRSRCSSIDNGEDLDDDNQSSSVITSSLSVSPPSQSISSRIISTITQSCDHNNNNNNNYPSSKQQSSHKYTCFTQDQSMTNVYDLEETYRSLSCSSSSIASTEEEDDLPFSRTLFTCRHRQRGLKKKGNTSNLSLVSTPSSEKNITSLCDLFSQAQENDNNNNKRILKIFRSTSIISNKKAREWKQNDGGFQRDVLNNDNSDDDDYIIRSSSSSIAAAADCLIRRQRRKQTRLKRKTGSETRKEKKKKKKERNKKSPSSTTEAEATEASLFQFFTVDTPTINTNAIFYPHEQASCADKSTTKVENYSSIETLGELHQQQKQECNFSLTMADGHSYTTPNPTLKKKENVRVFVHRQRRTNKHRQRVFLHSSSSNNSHETIPSSSDNVEELVSLIQQQINNKQKKSRKNKHIIVVNYKPVFINSRQQKSSQTTKTSPTSVPKPKPFSTDDDFSSATHYSRRRSLTTTSSDGSPLRSTINRSYQEQSVSLDLPDVEDPLMFIEMMYQQLFTEDGRLRSGTEPTILANCVKQIITNSRRNSKSSSIANGSTSPHLKHTNSNATDQQRKFSSSSYHPVTSSKPISLSSSPHLIPNEHYNTFSEEEEEEEEEEPKTVVQTNTQRSSIKTNIDPSGGSSTRLDVDNHSQIHAFLNSCHQKRSTTTHNGFHFSIDDTDNEDFDTFSDLNSIRFNNKTIRTSPSGDEDLTHTDSRLLSSSGYQSLDRSRKSFQHPQKPILSKSHSENDLISHSSHKNGTQRKCIHCCPNCIRPPTITVIPSLIPTPSSNIIQRIQQPIGMMLMKYLNFILISKNVLLLPFLIFLSRQRSMHLGN